MSYDYSENILVQESAGHLLENELGWEVAFAYNTEKLGENGTFGRKSYREILLARYFREALLRLNPWITPAQMDEAQPHWSTDCPPPPCCRSTRRSISSFGMVSLSP